MKNLILLIIILLTAQQLDAQRQEYIWNTIDFEEPCEYVEIDTSSQNIWEIGKPSKILFDSAYSITNAIITDSINNYPINNYSYFDLYIGYFNIDWYPEDIFIEIKHKFDTDTLKDGGYITVSYDMGSTWRNIIMDSVYGEVSPGWEGSGSKNLYSEDDRLFNGEYGFSGNSKEWISTWFCWHLIPVKSSKDFIGDTMIIRFNFISDSIENNKEGWMIDNIKLYSEDLGGGIDSSMPLEFKIFPNPMKDFAFVDVKKDGKIEICLYDIRGQLHRQMHYEAYETIRFEKDNLTPGIYFLKIRTNENIVGVKKLIVK